MVRHVRSETRLLYCDVGGAAVGFFGVDEDVDAGGEAGGEGAFERGSDFFRSLNQFAIAAEGFDHFVVANAGAEFRRRRMADNRALRVLDLPPRAIVADDGDDGQLLAHHALKLHAVQAKRAIAVQDKHLLTGAGKLRGHGEAGAGAQRTHRPRIEPVAGSVDVDDAPAIAYDVAAVAHYRRLL